MREVTIAQRAIISEEMRISQYSADLQSRMRGWWALRDGGVREVCAEPSDP
jgi:hypothetical protein